MPVFQLRTIIAFRGKKINPADSTAGLKFFLPGWVLFFISYEFQLAALAVIFSQAAAAFDFESGVSAIPADNHVNDIHKSSPPVRIL